MTPLAEQKLRYIVPRLMTDFGFSLDDVCAVFGNVAHECAGFTKMQEMKPAVAGSRGGYGWCQWTGDRRRAFEAYCAAKRLKIDSDEANYGYLAQELRTSERAAVAAVKAAVTLDEKVVVFEKKFERSGIPLYESRKKWANLARETMKSTPAVAPNAPAPTPTTTPTEVPVVNSSLVQMVIGLIVRHALTFIAGAIGINAAEVSSWEQGIVSAILAALGLAWSAYQKHKTAKAITSKS